MKVGAVESKYVYQSSRLNSDFHLTQGVMYDRFFRSRKHKLLGDLTLDIFCAGRSKRIYVSRENGIPYLGNVDLNSTDPIKGCNYTSKKFWKEQKGFIKEGMILTGRVGQNTVGSFTYAAKSIDGSIGSDNVIRIVSNGTYKNGFLYAFLASKFGFSLSRRHISGNAQPFITEDMLKNIPVPDFRQEQQIVVDKLITEAENIRFESNKILSEASQILKLETGLIDLNSSEYEHFGSHHKNRTVSTFSKRIKEISSLTINAFNYSKKVEELENRVREINHLPLFECLSDDHFFSTGSFKRLEIDSPNSIRLINQSDILNTRKNGKLIARKFVKDDRLVEYGEVIIAGVGTLAESEVFCRAIFANEELEGQLISGEFIRMKNNDKVPSGYLYVWLSSDYAFRFIRKTQSGTKLCRPIQALLKSIPVPILETKIMEDIDRMVKLAHTMQYEALIKENQAINLVEKEIESWKAA